MEARKREGALLLHVCVYLARSAGLVGRRRMPPAVEGSNVSSHWMMDAQGCDSGPVLLCLWVLPVLLEAVWKDSFVCLVHTIHGSCIRPHAGRTLEAAKGCCAAAKTVCHTTWAGFGYWRTAEVRPVPERKRASGPNRGPKSQCQSQ